MADKYSIYGNTNNNGYERGYFEPITIPFDDLTDYYFTVPDKYDQKPGNMAFDLYGTPRLYWIFAYFNQDLVEDPLFGVRAGMELRIPSKQRLMSYF